MLQTSKLVSLRKQTYKIPPNLFPRKLFPQTRCLCSSTKQTAQKTNKSQMTEALKEA